MSSARNNTLGSTVFQQTLKSCGAFVLVSLAILWIITGWLVWTMDAAQRKSITDSVTYAEEVYYGRGKDVLIAEEIQNEDSLLWSEAYIYEVLEEERQIWVLRGPDYEPIAGYYGLHSELGWEVGGLEHPEIWQPFRVHRVELRGGDTLAVAEFLPEDRANIIAFAQLGTVALLLIVLPLALITGYGLSQRVFRRIESISTTARSVGSGQMALRAEQSPRHDEFDRLAGNINQMLDQVETLNSNIESVSVGVAHDLRTPLTNIGGRLELIRRDCADPDAVVGHVEAAEAAQAQLMKVFDALLRLGEVKAGRRKSAFAPVDMSALVADICEAYAPLFADAHKDFRTEIAQGITLDGDQELLQQMMSNLLENALEHSRDAAKVVVTFDGAVLKVGDDGPGVSPPDRGRIFERFFRGDSSRGTPGNGLGLSLVQAIVDLHGATISLDPDRQGAVFSIQFQGDN